MGAMVAPVQSLVGEEANGEGGRVFAMSKLAASKGGLP